MGFIFQFRLMRDMLLHIVLFLSSVRRVIMCLRWNYGGLVAYMASWLGHVQRRALMGS